MSESSSISVSTLWRYPVKSMLGEELNASEINNLGVVGDRAFALLDVETGQVVSAKNPKKWPDFFAYRAAYATPPEDGTLPAVWITLPSGKTVRSDQADVDAVLSAALSRSVSLQVSAPESPVLEEYCPDNEGKDNEVIRAAMAGDAPVGTFFDYSTLHILTTSTIDQLRGLYPQGRFEVRRFRPNVVIDTTGLEGFVENDWVGKTIRIGESVRVHITDPCPRCVMPTLAQGDLPKDNGIFSKGIAQNRVHVPFAGKALPSIGVYARVMSTGLVRRGDSVIIE
ncbi:MAG: MOSC N-terminal beta barrel domain-containing protein [Candidatus Methylumidiphilus sp.]